jgi:2-keto-4-pentenoate hydratase/2-oxohepta-3-ene-1,7-dioic acid hydratase in catechol pathway
LPLQANHLLNLHSGSIGLKNTLGHYQLITHRVDKNLQAGVVIDTLVYEASKLLGNPHLNSVMAIMDAWATCNKLLTQKAKAIRAKEIRPKGIELKKCKLSAPLMYPGDIYCAGANYSDHMQEMARVTGLPPGPNMKELGEMPWHFIKSSRSTIVGPNTKVKIPHYSKMLDWEIELAVVIGKTCSQVLAKDAMKYVAGYTIANDLSARDAMRRPKNPPSSPFHMDWIGQKCFDGACPLGPWIVPADQVSDPHQLAMKLWVNDELMQDSNTNKLIFNIAEQIEALSNRITLHPGDLVLTGTPSGVGLARKIFLKPGDHLKLWIQEVGELNHTMVA